MARTRRSRSQVKRRHAALAALSVVGIIAIALPIINAVGGNGTSTARSSTTTTPRPELPVPPALLNPQGVNGDADMTSCTTDPGTVQAKGTVRNSATGPTDIVVNVSWINDRGDVLARGFATVPDLAAGTATEWSAQATLANGTPTVVCVLTANRGTLQQ